MTSFEHPWDCVNCALFGVTIGIGIGVRFVQEYKKKVGELKRAIKIRDANYAAVDRNYLALEKINARLREEIEEHRQNMIDLRERME